ncbi:hypothetical protein [Bacillus sp. JCM 19034]|uniref:hypothetical protein n=1 Tax=Bacillus sp. JCM 19034 TaxID=1481928 RepID=UPI000783B8C3|nr:hypothetical protein [Bacillus sp. JCM 19034]
MKMNGRTRLFMIVSFTHLFFLVIVLVKFKKKAIALLLSTLGFTYLFEYGVLNLLRMYRYKPKIFRNPWVDNVFGAFLSQAYFVPIKAVFITLFQYGWKMKIALALLLAAIEETFVKKGAFVKRTWKTPFTFFGVLFYFWFVDQWWRGFRSSKKKIIMIISLYLSNVVQYANVLFFLFSFTKAIRFRFPYRTSRSDTRDQFIVAPLYALLASVFSTAIILRSKRSNKIIGIGLLAIIDQILIRLGLLKLYKQQPLILLAIHVLTLLIGGYKHSLFLNVQKELKNEEIG